MTKCDVCGKDLAVKYKKDEVVIGNVIHASWMFGFGPMPKGCVDGEEKRLFGGYENKDYVICPECILRSMGIKPKEE